MTVRTMVGVIRFTAAALIDMHRWCLLYFADELDRAERAKQRRREQTR